MKEPLTCSSDLNTGGEKSKLCLLITSWMINHISYTCGKYINVGNGCMRVFGEKRNIIEVMKDGITHSIVLLIIFILSFQLKNLEEFSLSKVMHII